MTDLNIYKFEDVSVAIVDDHELVLEGFRNYMVKSGISQIETFTKARQLLERIPRHPFSIYILDVELPDCDATDLIDEIRSLQPGAKIIINTMHEEMWVVNKLAGKQVDGVMYKSGRMDQLLEAIATVNRGQKFFCKKFRRLQSKLEMENLMLSDRELEVLRYIAKGCSTKEIATRMFISENTVESHRKQLFRKLHANNMAEAIVKAISLRYIDVKELTTS